MIVTTPADRPFLRRGPSGPLMPREVGIVQEGFDNAVDAIVIPVGSGGIARNLTGDPLEVRFSTFEKNNVLVIDYRLSGLATDQVNAFPALIDVTPIVSVDGGATFFFASPSNALTTVQADGDKFNVQGLIALEMTDPMPVYPIGFTGAPPPPTFPLQPPIVRLVNFSGVDFAVSGNYDFDFGSLWLACQELARERCFQSSALAPPKFPGPFGVLLDVGC